MRMAGWRFALVVGELGAGWSKAVAEPPHSQSYGRSDRENWEVLRLRRSRLLRLVQSGGLGLLAGAQVFD